ncbi:MAG: hypothetical protein K6C12_10055 [Oscillospiraceae bacterium]|nr:hypothetical protein [Oscillospiraceae bacterium]
MSRGCRFLRNLALGILPLLAILFLCGAGIPENPEKEENPLPEDGRVYSDLGQGTFCLIRDAFVYIPEHCDDNTGYLLHYAGGTGGLDDWVLQQQYPEYYLREYRPNAVCVFFKGSGLRDIPAACERTGELLAELGELTGVRPEKIAVSAASNGGYTALHAACRLYTDYGIRTDRILLLDMGDSWSKEELLITGEEAAPLLEMGTTVYALGAEGDAFTLPGAQKFASSGVPLIEVVSRKRNHDEMTVEAFQEGVLSFLLGESARLNEKRYTLNPVN